MAYTINKTDGSVVATITDGTIDNSTSLTLFGKSYSGFGELLNENLLKLLENSASTAQPTTPFPFPSAVGLQLPLHTPHWSL